MVKRLPEGTIERILPHLTVDGVPYNGPAEFSLGSAPYNWHPGEVVNGKLAYRLSGLEAAGFYMVWARVSDDPEFPLIPCGFLEIYET
jgi:hypothetical protein